MTTTTVSTIGSGGTYSTIQAWEDAAPANLVTSDVVWQGQLLNQGFTSGSDILTVGGSTTDATRYKHLTCQAGNSFRDSAPLEPVAYTGDGSSITITGSYTSGILVSENNFRLSNIGMRGTGSSSGVYNSSQSGMIVENCVFATKKTEGFVFAGSGTITNVAIIGRSSGVGHVKATGGTWVNCTIACPLGGTNGFNFTNYGAITLKNVAVFGYTNFKTGNASNTCTTCMTSATTTSPTGVTGSIAHSTANFNNVTDISHDYRLKTGSALLDVGTLDSTNAPLDIFGTARPQGSGTDVGCYELPVTAARLPRSFKAVQAVNRSASY